MYQPGTDEYFMQLALVEAQKAFDEDEVPIGAVIVVDNKVVARGYNQVERLNDATAHAEMLTLTSAFSYLGSKYVADATLYVTIEPCLMCCGAIYWGKISRIVFGASDEKNGYRHYTQNNWPFHPKAQLVTGILETECANIVKNFFKAKR